MHFISYWKDVKLSDTHSSQATLFNKEHIITDISCRGLRLLSPSSVFYLCLFSYIFSASSAFPPQDCSCWFSHGEQSEWYNCRGRKWCCWFNRVCFSFWVSTEQLSHCAQNILEQEVCLWCVWACVLISLTQNMERLHRRDFNYLESYWSPIKSMESSQQATHPLYHSVGQLLWYIQKS